MRGSLEYVKKLRDGSLFVKDQITSQIKDLLKLTKIHNLKVKATKPVGLNTCKDVIFHRNLIALDKQNQLFPLQNHVNNYVDHLYGHFSL